MSRVLVVFMSMWFIVGAKVVFEMLMLVEVVFLVWVVLLVLSVSSYGLMWVWNVWIGSGLLVSDIWVVVVLFCGLML